MTGLSEDEGEHVNNVAIGLYHYGYLQVFWFSRNVI